VRTRNCALAAGLWRCGCARTRELARVLANLVAPSPRYQPKPTRPAARLGWDAASGRLPIFGMALRPTAAVIGALMRRLAARARR
jgi:hypothetical protein